MKVWGLEVGSPTVALPFASAATACGATVLLDGFRWVGRLRSRTNSEVNARKWHVMEGKRRNLLCRRKVWFGECDTLASYLDLVCSFEISEWRFGGVDWRYWDLHSLFETVCDDANGENCSAIGKVTTLMFDRRELGCYFSRKPGAKHLFWTSGLYNLWKSRGEHLFCKRGFSLFVVISWKMLSLDVWIVTLGGSFVTNARFASVDSPFRGSAQKVLISGYRKFFMSGCERLETRPRVVERCCRGCNGCCCKNAPARRAEKMWCKGVLDKCPIQTCGKDVLRRRVDMMFCNIDVL